MQELLATNESVKEAQLQQRAELQRLAQEKEALESKVEVLGKKAEEAAETVEQARTCLDEIAYMSCCDVRFALARRLRSLHLDRLLEVFDVLQLKRLHKNKGKITRSFS